VTTVAGSGLPVSPGLAVSITRAHLRSALPTILLPTDNADHAPDRRTAAMIC